MKLLFFKYVTIFRNVRNHLLYSDKFTLSVVNLNQISLATVEDKAYQIDYWAALFKAGTWEELQMLTKDNEYLQEAAESLYTANADEIIRQQCIAREDAERRERTLERNYKLAQEALAEKDSALAEMGSALAEKDSALAEMNSFLNEKDSAMNKMKLEIEQLKALLENSSK